MSMNTKYVRALLFRPDGASNLRVV